MKYSEDNAAALKEFRQYSSGMSHYLEDALKGKNYLNLEVYKPEGTQFLTFNVCDFEMDDGIISLIGQKDSERFDWYREDYELKQGRSAPCKFELHEFNDGGRYATMIFNRTLSKK